MLKAPPTVRCPQQVLDAWVDLAKRLCDDHGVVLRLSPIPGGTVNLGDLNEATGTLLIREDAALSQQVWLMQQVWNFLTFGPHASPTARRKPLLSLVPSPREAPDSQTA
jgi:hypothetical protein